MSFIKLLIACLMRRRILFWAGSSGAVVILGSLLRNILVYTNKINHVIIWLIMAMMVVCGLSLNQHGWIGILPIVANLSYTLWLCYGGQRAKSVKIVLAVNMLIWAVYDFTMPFRHLYPTALFLR